MCYLAKTTILDRLIPTLDGNPKDPCKDFYKLELEIIIET